MRSVMNFVFSKLQMVSDNYPIKCTNLYSYDLNFGTQSG